MEHTKAQRPSLHSGLLPLTRDSQPASFNEHHCVNMDEVSQLFEKKFQYQRCPGSSAWTLPPPAQLFSEYYQLEPLQQLKQRLNYVKCKLNDYVLEDWSVHTRRQDPSSEIPWRIKSETKAEFVTIAWCKFFECLHSFPLVKSSQLNSLHLCELPGAFITALNHYLYSKYDKNEVHWKWLSTTLNPYYEGNPSSGMISDDRFMFHTFDNWLMHDDFTGNIISHVNIEQMQAQCVSRLDNCVQLITADGSIDCVDAPDCQEEVVAKLHFAEIVAALSILADGGCFVIKTFTLFEATNVCKLFLLNCAFEKVHVFKPVTSKRGNSEVYVVCLNYKKHAKHLPETLQLMKSKLQCNNVLPLFGKKHLPCDFLWQHEICARLFMNLQIDAIESNIRTYEFKPTREEIRYKRMLRSEIANEFYRRFNVHSIPTELTILQGQQLDALESFKSTPLRKGSYSEREMLKETPLTEQIFMLHRILNELEKTLDAQHGVLLLEDDDIERPADISPLRVYRGAPFSKLSSSLFVNPHVMLMYHRLKDILSRDPLWQDAPVCLLNNKEIKLNYSTTDDYSSIQRQFFLNVVDAICKQRPRQIVLKNVAFLTHFAVSLLRFLSIHVFEHFSISTEPSFEVTLREKQMDYDAAKKANLIKLRDLLMNDSRVLCVLELKCLHRNEFHCALSKYNNLLLLKNFQLMLKN